MAGAKHPHGKEEAKIQNTHSIGRERLPLLRDRGSRAGALIPEIGTMKTKKECAIPFTNNGDHGRTELASKAVQRLTQLINVRHLEAVIDIYIKECIEGTLCGRMRCGELGVGWVVLDLHGNCRAKASPHQDARFWCSGLLGCVPSPSR